MLFYQRVGQTRTPPTPAPDGPTAPASSGRCRTTTAVSSATRTTPRPSATCGAAGTTPAISTSTPAGRPATSSSCCGPTPKTRPSGPTTTEFPNRATASPTCSTRPGGGSTYLARLQGADGSVLSIVGEATASPPSSATGRACTAGRIRRRRWRRRRRSPPARACFARLEAPRWRRRRRSALARAEAPGPGPSPTRPCMFKNNDSASGSSGLGSGQQETDDYGRMATSWTPRPSCSPPRATPRTARSSTPTTRSSHLIAYGNYVAPWDMRRAGRGARLRRRRRRHRGDGQGDPRRLPGGRDEQRQPGRDHRQQRSVPRVHARLHLGEQLDEVEHGDPLLRGGLPRAGRRRQRRHDPRGVALPALPARHQPAVARLPDQHVRRTAPRTARTRSSTRGSPTAARSGTASGRPTYGPPPGFLAGGPNPSYDWDGCCPSGCGSTGNNAICTAESISPPKGQPAQKSYKDFNTGWPLDSWSVTEPSDGYQVAYIRLLSKFVR